MKKTQGGFTLIELVVVIVLLGILGVTALGRFQDLSQDAAVAASQGIASELAAGSAINYAEGIIDNSYTATVNQTDVCTQGILGGLLQANAWPDATITVAETAAGSGDCSVGTGVGPGGTASCSIDHPATGAGVDATANVICGG